MNRVSEALRRAAEEGFQSSTTTVDEPRYRVDQTRDGNSPSENSNGASRPTTVPESRAVPKRRLRRRIQELLVGGDLRSHKDHPLVALEKHSPAAEQYKILREHVRKISNGGKASVLVITSPLKGDGKTKVAANLAAAMALDYEERVLLIDADLRSPSIHPYFGIKATPGLSDYLVSNSEKNLMCYVQGTFLPGLRILPAGKASVNSAELLATEKMKRLVKGIPLEFPGHRIIIDTSPVLSTPDPLVLSRQVDGTVMVVRAGKTPRDCVSKAIDSLGSNNFIGLILNGAELGIASKYYHAGRS
jgi:protein-tyrosine kinase